MGWKRKLGFACGGLASIPVIMGVTFRLRTKPKKMDYEKRDIRGQVAVVTGASSGIGREVALGLAREGAHVILASRSFQKLNTLAAEIESMGCSASVIMIDLSVKSSIDHFCRQLFSEHDSVNILINNASMINFEGRTVFAKEESFMTNHLGPFYLTHKLFTSLNESGKPEEKSRIVNVNSRLAKRGDIDMDEVATSGFTRDFDWSWQTAMDAYADSKLANLFFTYKLHERIREENWNVSVNAVSPGMVHTELWRNYPNWYKRLTYPFRAMFLRSAKEGAQGVLQLVLSKDVEGKGGIFWADGEILEDPKNPEMEGLRRKQMDMLWLTSLDLLQMDEFGIMV